MLYSPLYIHIYLPQIQNLAVSLTDALAFSCNLQFQVPHLRDIPAEVGAGICCHQGGPCGPCGPWATVAKDFLGPDQSHLWIFMDDLPAGKPT